MYKFSKIQKQIGANVLYRFVPFNQYSLQSLLNQRLYFSNPHFQNDPIDSRYTLDLSEFPSDHYKDSISNESPETITKRFIRVQIDRIIKDNYGIVCFSKKYNNILLWSHYTLGATGFCIMFDKSRLYKSLLENNKSMEIDDVTYGRIPAIVPTLQDKSLHFNHRDIIFHKHSEWKYETEVRILCKLEKNIWKDPIRQYKFDPESIICLLLGERMKYDERITLRNI